MTLALSSLTVLQATKLIELALASGGCLDNASSISLVAWRTVSEERARVMGNYLDTFFSVETKCQVFCLLSWATWGFLSGISDHNDREEPWPTTTGVWEECSSGFRFSLCGRVTGCVGEKWISEKLHPVAFQFRGATWISPEKLFSLFLVHCSKK